MLWNTETKSNQELSNENEPIDLAFSRLFGIRELIVNPENHLLILSMLLNALLGTVVVLWWKGINVY